MKTIHVVAAIIVKNHKVLAMKRNYGKMKDGWEFPGGKVEADETNQAALKREIHEELSIDIFNLEYFDCVQFDYDDFHLTMDCYLCTCDKEDMMLKVHSDYRWLSSDELNSVDWLQADRVLIPKIKCHLHNLND